MEGKGIDCIPAPIVEGGSGVVSKGGSGLGSEGGSGLGYEGGSGLVYEGGLAAEEFVICDAKGPTFGEHGVCAICFDKIKLQEMALVKGCEHAYCVTCILRWATYKEKHSCPQCKNPFEFLNVHRSIDGTIHDYMFEESVCLLLRANWFVPLVVPSAPTQDDGYEDDLYSYYYDDDLDGLDEDLEDGYYSRSFSTLRIGNRRWGDSGYVRAGRKEARPVNKQFCDETEAGPSRTQKTSPKENVGTAGGTGRRAKRALKREAANKAAVAAAGKTRLSI